MLIMFGKLHVGVDVTLRGSLLPKAQGLFEIAAALLENGEPAHSLPEIRLGEGHLQAALEQARSGVPLAEIFVEPGERDHVRSPPTGEPGGVTISG